MKENEDDKLMQQLSEGDNNSFGQLFDGHSKSVLGYALRLCGGNMSLAEDISQTSWMRVIQNAQNYRQQGQFRAWLKTIVRNCAFDTFRKNKVNLNFEDLEESNSAILNIDPQDIENDFAKLQEIEKIQKQLDLLPTAQRMLFLSFINEKLSYAELANVYNLSVSAVKSHLFRIRKNLKSTIEDDT